MAGVDGLKFVVVALLLLYAACLAADADDPPLLAVADVVGDGRWRSMNFTFVAVKKVVM